jgi:hypothetical protein
MQLLWYFSYTPYTKITIVSNMKLRRLNIIQKSSHIYHPVILLLYMPILKPSYNYLQVIILILLLVTRSTHIPVTQHIPKQFNNTINDSNREYGNLNTISWKGSHVTIQSYSKFIHNSVIRLKDHVYAWNILLQHTHSIMCDIQWEMLKNVL